MIFKMLSLFIPKTGSLVKTRESQGYDIYVYLNFFFSWINCSIRVLPLADLILLQILLRQEIFYNNNYTLYFYCSFPSWSPWIFPRFPFPMRIFTWFLLAILKGIQFCTSFQWWVFFAGARMTAIQICSGCCLLNSVLLSIFVCSVHPLVQTLSRDRGFSYDLSKNTPSLHVWTTKVNLAINFISSKLPEKSTLPQLFSELQRKKSRSIAGWTSNFSNS